MSGYVHIIRLYLKTGTHGVEISDYQVNYVDAGTNFAVSWDEDRLIEFLHGRVALAEVEVAEIIDQLHRTGSATVGDVDIPPNEATMMGMQMVSEDDSY